MKFTTGLRAGAATASVLAVGGLALARYMRLSPGPDRLSLGQHVFGHRGCRNITGIPENTLEAFGYAKAGGASGIELDCRVTHDGHIVVMHDNFVRGMLETDSTECISDMALADLRKLRYRADPAKKVVVPTLEEAIVFCRDSGLCMLIEVKEKHYPAKMVEGLLDLYARYSEYLESKVTIISFEPQILYQLRARNPKVAVCILWTDNLISSLIKAKIERLPFYMYWCPAFFDMYVRFVQERICPWLLGCSMVGPKYTLFSERFRNKWLSKKTLVYLWGFPSEKECTCPMKEGNVLIGADDKYKLFTK